MVIKKKIKLKYRQASFLEGASRIFDITGIFQDEVMIINRKPRSKSLPEKIKNDDKNNLFSATHQINQDVKVVTIKARHRLR
ncbi:hypothetical protein RIF25_13560 [Thermosynechococcaceae cyanobacterium BACA0444]|uniref:Uncharacterized protein n=1 Tax=Pseudocalidococcus azoricus BACA0444 TaxID=2918990 RepID=A0AAE4FVI6_9CYAN|nr:hypothetical protein [Pseudocalidococcus azoricus]MDS3861831.1 hypothetical protein [Pseudocalidococcus azoricus BACA0444]